MCHSRLQPHWQEHFSGILRAYVLQGTAATAGWIGSHTFVREELKIGGGEALMRPAETRFLGLFLASIAVGEDRTAVSVTHNSTAVGDWARKQPKPAKQKGKNWRTKMRRR